MPTNGSIQRDQNYAPILGNHAMLAIKSVTFAAGTTGAVGSFDLFTVTGDVLVTIFAVCETDLTSGGAAAIEVGTANDTGGLIVQTSATDIDAGLIWQSNTPSEIGTELPNGIPLSGASVQYTVGADTITGGKVNFYCLWRPLSAGSSVVAA
jgi:hypothetical protein